MTASTVARGIAAVSGVLAATLATLALSTATASAAAPCTATDRPCVVLDYQRIAPNVITAHIQDSDINIDDPGHYNVRWSINRSGAIQTFAQAVVPLHGNATLPVDATNRHAVFDISVQVCSNGGLFKDTCSPWDTDSLTPVPLAYGFDTCASGYIWREAYGPDDHTCVAPSSHDQAAADNAAASGRGDPNGAYGPDTCQNGYIWREARPTDHVCVIPPIHDQTVAENRDANLHRVP